MTEYRIELEGLEDRIARLNGKLKAIVRAADRAVGVGAEIVLGEARLNLTGRVLKVDTGRLRGSLARVHERGSLESTVGTNVSYGRRHEFGFHGTESVRAHERVMRKVFGRRLKAPINVMVRAFTRQANTPERPWLRPALRDSIPRIEKTFTALVEAALTKAGA